MRIIFSVLMSVIFSIVFLSCGDDGGDDESGDTKAPPAVTEFTIVPGDGVVKMSWVAPHAEEATEYCIIKSAEAAPTSCSRETSAFYSGGLSAEDRNVTNDTKYYYSIFVVDYSNNFSGAVSGTVTPHEGIVLTFVDTAFADEVNSELGQSSGDEITDLAIWEITDLNVSDEAVASIADVAHFKILEKFTFSGATVADLEPLKKFTKLRFLSFSNTNISDLTALSSLTSLDELRMTGSSVADLTPIATLTSLTKVSVNQSSVTSLDAFEKLVNITRIEVQYCTVSDLTPLAGLSALTNLVLNQTQVTKLDSIMSLEKLETLALYNAPLSANTISVQLPQLEAAGVTISR